MYCFRFGSQITVSGRSDHAILGRLSYCRAQQHVSRPQIQSDGMRHERSPPKCGTGLIVRNHQKPSKYSHAKLVNFDSMFKDGCTGPIHGPNMSQFPEPWPFQGFWQLWRACNPTWLEQAWVWLSAAAAAAPLQCLFQERMALQ